MCEVTMITTMMGVIIVIIMLVLLMILVLNMTKKYHTTWYLSGGSVRIISLHGAVAGTAAPRAHTALRASNLRLKTSNFTLFHQQRWTFLGALRRSTYKTPPSLSSTSSTTALLAVYRRSVPKLFYFLPIQGNPIGPLVPTTVGLKFGSTYNKNYRQTFTSLSLCL